MKVQDATLQTPEKQTSSAVSPIKGPQTEPSRKSTATRTSIASPDYAFTFRHPSTELSNEAQRIMDSVRDEAARIKSHLTQQRERQTEQDARADAVLGGRRLVQPKGKLTRYSDLHMEQFKKMDSIAGHASSFRADPNRSTKDMTAFKGLKRTNSKVDLDQSSSPQHGLKRTNSKAELDSVTTPQSLKRVNSKSNIPAPSRPTTPKSPIKVVTAVESGTPEQGPAKRRKTIWESQAAAKPSSDITAAPAFAHQKNAQSLIPRSPSSKTLIPSAPTKRPSTPNASPAAPTVPQSAPPARSTRSMFASKLAPFKSILRKPQIKFSDDPLKQAAGTHVAPPKDVKTPEQRTEKHVVFTPEPVKVHEVSPLQTPEYAKEPEASPSPVKQVSVSAVARNRDGSGDSEWMDVDDDSMITEHAPTYGPANNVSYPSLVPASAPPKPAGNTASGTEGDFTFKFAPSSHLSFASPTRQALGATGPFSDAIGKASQNKTHTFFPDSPIKSSTFMSPMKSHSQPNFLAPTSSSKSKVSALSTPTIRKVRPSTSAVNTTSPQLLPGIDHGLSNKKRKRSLDDVGTKSGEHEKENTPQKASDSPAKKVKTGPSAPTTPAKTPITLKGREKRMSAMKSAARFASPAARRLFSPGSKAGSPSPKKSLGDINEGVGSPKPGSARKGLSWKRLEELAMPKKRV